MTPNKHRGSGLFQSWNSRAVGMHGGGYNSRVAPSVIRISSVV